MQDERNTTAPDPQFEMELAAAVDELETQDKKVKAEDYREASAAEDDSAAMIAVGGAVLPTFAEDKSGAAPTQSTETEVGAEASGASPDSSRIGEAVVDEGLQPRAVDEDVDAAATQTVAPVAGQTEALGTAAPPDSPAVDQRSGEFALEEAIAVSAPAAAVQATDPSLDALAQGNAGAAAEDGLDGADDDADDGANGGAAGERSFLSGVTLESALARVEDGLAPNKAPTDISLASGGVALETLAPGGVVATLSASDGDSGERFRFSLEADPSGLFEIVGAEVRLKLDAALDFETAESHALTVQVTDSRGASYSETITLSVTDAGDAVTLGDGGVVFTDTGAAETVITGGDGADQLTAHDDGGALHGGGGDDVLTGGAGDDVLDGGGGSGDVAVFSGTWADYTITDDGGVYTVTHKNGGADGSDTVRGVETFRFSDGAGGVVDVAAADALNAAPTDIAVESGGSVAESAAPGAVVATLSASDVNANDGATFELTSDPSGLFEVSGTEIRLAAGASLDYEAAASHDVEIRVTDAHGASYTETVTLSVTDVAEAVTLGDGGVSYVDTGAAETVITGGDGADQLTAHDDGGTLYGGDGRDTLTGGAGDDVIYTGRDGDRVDGGEGSDTIFLDAISNGDANVITDSGSAGTDTIVLQKDTGRSFEIQSDFSAASGIEVIDGSRVSGERLQSQGPADWDFTGVTLTGIDKIDGGNEADKIIGSAGDDFIEGDGGSDTLAGGAGNDRIDGGDGRDTLTGGAGDDVIYTGRDGDRVDGGEGSDTIFLDAISNGDANVITDSGSAGTDTIVLQKNTGRSFEIQSDFSAASGIEVIDGSGVSGERLQSYGAVDWDFTGVTLTGVDKIDGGNEADRIIGSAGDDFILGDRGSDTLSGGGGNDRLRGDNGDDVLTGGAGDDVLDGGSGAADVAVFSGAWADYTITEDGGVYTVTHKNGGADGSDTVQNVETFRFSDGDLSASDLLTGPASSEDVSGAPSVQPDSIVGHWSLGDASGQPQDSSSGGNHAQLHGDASLGADGPRKGSKAVSLDGSGDYVEIDGGDYALASGSVALWFKPDKLSGDQALISRDSMNYDGGGHLTIWVTDVGEIKVRHQSDSDNVWVTSAENLVTAGEWSQLTYSWGPNGVELFLNGESVGSDATPRTLEGNSEPFTLGASQARSGDAAADNLRDHFSGDVADFSVYNAELSLSDAAALFAEGDGGADAADAAPASFEASIVGHWSLGDASGQPQDSASAGNHAQLLGDASLGADGPLDGSNAVSLDGSGDYVEIGNGGNYALASGSVALWFKPDDLSGDQALISRDSRSYDGGGHLTIWVTDGGEIKVRHQSDSDNVWVTSAGNLVTAGEWSQLTYSWGPNGVELFLNGESVGSDATPRTLEGNAEPFTLGASQVKSSDATADKLRDHFSGDVAEFTVFSAELTGAEAAALYAEGEGGAATADPGETGALSGGAGVDAFTGGGSADTYFGFAGADEIGGGGGDDVIYGGSGADTIDAGDGQDRIYGGSGNDVITAGAGDDTVFGGAGDDQITAGTGQDTIFGGAGDDTIDGEGGDDTVVFDGAVGGFEFSLSSGAGDALQVSDTVGSEGVDQLQNVETLSFNGVAYELSLGGSSADTFTNQSGAQLVVGGAGDDTFELEGGSGEDFIDGGSGGTDRIDLGGFDDSFVGSTAQVYETSGWTLTVTEGSITSVNGDSVSLAQDSAGRITYSNGDEVEFQNLESIAWT